MSDSVTSNINSANGSVDLLGSVESVSGVGQNLDLGYSINGDGTFQTNFDFASTELSLDGSLDGSFLYQRGDGYTQSVLAEGDGNFDVPESVNAVVSETGDPGSDLSVSIRFNGTGLTNSYSNVGIAISDQYALALRSTTDPRGNQITYQYGSDGKLLSITDTQGRLTTLGYPSGAGIWDSPTTITDNATSRTTTLSYRSAAGFNQLTSVTDPDANTTRFAYQAGAAPMLDYVQIPGETTTRAADYTVVSRNGLDADPVTSVTYGYGSPSASTFTYTGYGVGPVVETDPNGGHTSYAHDSMDRVTSVTDPLGHQQSSAWTPADNPKSRTNALSAVTSYSYDTLNNLTKATSPAGTGTSASQSFSYPTATGSLADFAPKTSKDAQGNTTTFTYNSSYQLATSATPNSAGGTPTNHYQGDPGISCQNGKPGELCSSVDGNGNTTSYAYNSDGNLQTVTRPSPLGATSFTYDADGRQISQTDGAGKQTFTQYDRENRVISVGSVRNACSPISCTAYTYNGAGWLTQRVDPSGTTSYTYDAQGHVLTMNTPTGNTSYTWDGNGNMTSYSDGGGTVNYRYDAANRLIFLSEPGGNCPASPSFPNSTKCTKFGYDNADSRNSVTYPNGQTTAITYDAAGRELSVVAKNSASAILASRTYSYANSAADMDLRHSVTDQSGVTTTYTYDSMNRVTSANTSSGTQSWTYDSNGNRLTSVSGGATIAAKYNAANELCYTAATNTAACGATPAGGTTFNYDGEGNLTAATSGAITAASYTIFNQTASTTHAGTVTNNSYSDTSSDQRTSAGPLTYGNGLLGLTRQSTAGGSTEFVRDPNGNLVAMETGGSSYYYTTDALGSTILLTSSTGASVATYQYDTWGSATNSLTTEGSANPWRYAGGYADANGLVKFGTRYYNPALGRFTQQDPSGQEDNAYAYAENNPVNSNDPSGRKSASAALVELLEKIADGYSIGQAIKALATGDSETIASMAVSAIVSTITDLICTGIVTGVTAGVGLVVGVIGCTVLAEIVGTAVTGGFK